jgi:hypothetical protein
MSTISTILLIDPNEKKITDNIKSKISKKEIPFGQAAWMEKIKSVSNEINQLGNDPNTSKFKVLLNGEMERIEKANEEINKMMQGYERSWFGPSRGGRWIKNGLFVLSGLTWVGNGTTTIVNVAASNNNNDKTLGIVSLVMTTLATLTTGVTGLFWCLYTNSQNQMIELSNMQLAMQLAQMDHLENMSNFIRSLQKLYGKGSLENDLKKETEIEKNNVLEKDSLVKEKVDTKEEVEKKKESLVSTKNDAFAECIDLLKKLHMNEISTIDRDEKIPKMVSFLIEFLPEDHPIRLKYSIIANLMTKSFKMDLEKKNHLNTEEKEVKIKENGADRKEENIDEIVIEIADEEIDLESEGAEEGDDGSFCSFPHHIINLDSIDKDRIQIIDNVIIVHSDFFCKHWKELEEQMNLELPALVTKNGDLVKKPLSRKGSFYKISTPLKEIKTVFDKEIVHTSKNLDNSSEVIA